MPPDPAPPLPGTVGWAGDGTIPRVGRRTVLQAAGTALVGASLAACGVRWDDVRVDDLATPTPPALGPDDLARFGAVVSVQALLDLATAVQDPVAGAVAERHRAHLARLGPLPGPIPSPSSTPSGWPTTSPPPQGPEELAVLAAAELATATGLIASAGGADSRVEGPLALLLVAVGARCRVTAASLGAEVAATVLPEEPDPSGLGSATEQLATLVEAHRAAAYGYGVLAVRLDDVGRDTGRAAIGTHRAAAQHLVDLGAEAGADVPAARPGYAVAVPADAVTAAALALALELDVAAAAGSLVVATTGQWRTLAADHLADVALEARAWGEVPAFPGAPALD